MKSMFSGDAFAVMHVKNFRFFLSYRVLMTMASLMQSVIVGWQIEELKTILKPGGTLYIVEPKMHVAGKAFEKMTSLATNAGFEITNRPKVFFSRTIMLRLTV